jgi:DNA-binding CsgD family transcriptional regulator
MSEFRPDGAASVGPELLERGPIQLELSRLLRSAAVGEGKIVFLGGEAGIGKTSLVQRFAGLVRNGARVLVGACDPLSTPRPLGPLLDMRDQLGSRISDQIDRSAPKDDLFRAFLGEIADGVQPTLVVFEDVHWADEATLDLLRFLAKRIGTTKALLIATYRDDEVGDRHPLRVVLGDVATLPAVMRLQPQPLTAAAVRRLAADTALDPIRLHAQTGGNPFFVTEVIETGGDGIPPTVRDAILARAARLPTAARAVVSAAAVLGFRFEPWLLESIVETTPEVVDACIAGGLLRISGDRLAFRHELVREAMLDTCSPQRRRVVHRAALEALRAADDTDWDLGRLAHHAEGAGDADSVLAFAPAAARKARNLGASREAVVQYERALRFADHFETSQLVTILEEYSHASATINQWDKAISADHRILAIYRREGNRLKEGWALTYLASCLTSVGRTAEAEEANLAAIEILEGHPSGPELCSAYLGQASLRLLERQVGAAVEWAQKSLRIAEDCGDEELLMQAHRYLGAAMIVHGKPEGEKFVLKSLEIARRTGSHWGVAAACNMLGTALVEMFDLERGNRYLAEGLKYAVEYEQETFQILLNAVRGVAQMHLGRWPEAEESAGEALSRCRKGGLDRVAPLVVRGCIRIRQGVKGGDLDLEEALELAHASPVLPRLARVRAARAEAAWLASDLERARLEAGADLALALDRQHPWYAGQLLVWMRRAGETITAPSWIAEPYRLELQGNLCRAAAEWRRLGCAYEAAVAEIESGEPDALRHALEVLRDLGAESVARLAMRRLREIGVRDIPRGPRPSTRDNAANLTRRQSEILHLLAEGLTNAEIARRLFVSPKTASHHVSAVLEKLDARTRTEAVREASRLGLLDDEGATTAH